MKALTRAEAIKALIAGKKVERTHTGLNGSIRTEKIRWHEDHGIQCRQSASNTWDNESGSCHPGFYTYREVFTPRVFLCRWEEVETWADAEIAGDGMCMCVLEANSASPVVSSRIVGNINAANDCWVRRIPGK